MGGVPGDDLCAPAAQCPGERAGLDGHLTVGHVRNELVQQRCRSVGIDDRIESANGLFCMPGHAHRTMGVAGFEQRQQFRVAGLTESFMALGQQSSAAVERVVVVTAMALSSGPSSAGAQSWTSARSPGGWTWNRMIRHAITAMRTGEPVLYDDD